MGQAKIVDAIGEGQFHVNYQYNTERIEFEIKRAELRRDEIDPQLLLEATQALDDANIKVQELASQMNDLIHNLNGEVSPTAIAEIQKAVDALDNADALNVTTNLRLVSSGLSLDDSVAAFPVAPPPTVTAAYNAAYSALNTATFALGAEQTALNTAQGYAASALSLAQATTPDVNAVRAAIEAARNAMHDVTAASNDTTGEIANAIGTVSAAGSALPSDPGWEDAQTFAEEASFALTNSDLTLGEIGAQPTHAQVGASYTSANAALTKAANLLTPGNAETKKEIVDTLKKLNVAHTEAQLAQVELDQLYLELANLETKITELNQVEQETRVSLWCADFTTEIDTARAVGTCEVPGQYGTTGEVVIHPGFRDAELDWNQARDGFMTPCQGMTPSGTYYNWAMRPGWQVYRPTYRFAKITQLNDDGTVDLEIIEPNKASDLAHDPAGGSQQPIVVTPKPIPEPHQTEEPATKILKKIEVKYMDCNQAAFLVNDEVLVQYEEQKAEKARVIGFRNHPRECAAIRFCTTAEYFRIPQEIWQRTAITGQQYGNAYWSGAAGALSWYGWSSRYRDQYELRADSSVGNPLASPQIFAKGELLAAAPGRIRGAALTLAPGQNGAKWLIAVCLDLDVQQAGSSVEFVYAKNLDQIGALWILLAEESYSTVFDDYPFFTGNSMNTTAWFFNQSGNQAITVKPLGAWPSGDFNRTRMVQLDISFVEGVPQAVYSYPTIRHPEYSSFSGQTDTLFGLGQFGSNGEYHLNQGQSWYWYDQFADYVGDTLTTVDEFYSETYLNDIICGDHILSLGNMYNPGGGEVVSLTGSNTTNFQRDRGFVNSALGLSITRHDSHLTSLSWEVTTFQEYTDEEGTTLFPQFAYTNAESQQLNGDVFLWGDITSGAGKMQYVAQNENRDWSVTGVEKHQYSFDGVSVTMNEVIEPLTTISTATAAVHLVSGVTTLEMGSLIGSAHDDPLNGELWACADRRQHCLVAHALLNLFVGAPNVFPEDTILTFKPVGLG